MQIEVSSAERDTLVRYLERVLVDLRFEISNTEQFDFRQTLKSHEENIKAVLARLGAPVP